MTDRKTAVAKAICQVLGHDPQKLEPGDIFGIDGYKSGDPCHFQWREFVYVAEAAIEAYENTTE